MRDEMKEQKKRRDALRQDAFAIPKRSIALDLERQSKHKQAMTNWVEKQRASGTEPSFVGLPGSNPPKLKGNKP